MHSASGSVQGHICPEIKGGVLFFTFEAAISFNCPLKVGSSGVK